MTGNVFICSCDKTISLDKSALKGQIVDQLCRRELSLAQKIIPDIVTCTQEAAIFQEINPSVRLINIRENAGWSDEGAKATPKIMALIEMAKVALSPVKQVTLTSKGVALIYGGEEAIKAAEKLKNTLDVTVILSSSSEITPPAQTDYPLLKGKIRTAKGVLGDFTYIIDDYALPLPSSRKYLVFGETQKNIEASSDIFIDLSNEKAFFPHFEVRSGYLRSHKHEDILFEASALVGTFDKPQYINYSAEICAHSRSKITGCTKCLDLCPTGAISSQGDHVSIDAGICAGCGACAASCPTGAASYALPTSETVLKQLRILISTYLKAGGKKPILLIHDEKGQEQIAMLARFGRGLPAHVLPFLVNDIASLGLEIMTSSFAYGAEHIAFLQSGKSPHDLSSLLNTQNEILEQLGFGTGLISIIDREDPDLIREDLDQISVYAAPHKNTSFLPLGSKRQLLETSMREIAANAPKPLDLIALSQGAPFGTIEVNKETCTLCLACVSACPASALSDNSETPMLRFSENLCVQCGICAKTCPEKAISLKPQIDIKAWNEPKRVLNEAEPFHCITCAKPFGTKAVIDKMQDKLKSHWMFSGDNKGRLTNLMMCDTCRIERAANEGFDPYAAKPRPNVIVTEDYK